MKNLVFLLTVYFCCTSAFAAKHTLIAPQVLRIGVPEHVVLNLHEGKGQVTVIATLKLNGVQNYPQLPQDASKPINIYVKYDLQPEEQFDDNRRTYVELLVSARNSAGVKVYDGYLKMRLIKVSGYLHVQTDRPIYRPEETVNVRVIALTQLQSPETHRQVEIVIRIPMDNVAVEKKKLQMEANKLIETSFKIPEFPVYGVWSIEARYEEEAVARWSTIKFSVRPYVLPTFNVGLQLDKQFLLVKDNMADEYITGKITAKYSYGRTVTGSYFLAAKLKRPHMEQPVLFYQFPDKMKVKASIVNGAQNFRIKGTEVLKVLQENENFYTLVKEGATMTVECSVTGTEEGVIESELSAPVHFVKSPYTIDITRMSKYYSPGTSFEIKADILDSISKKPLAGVDYIITDAVGTKIVKDIRSDANGQINVKINMPASKGKKTYKIQTLDFDVPDENEAVSQFEIESYDSPSNSILQLSAAKKIAGVGDNNFGIDIWYSKNPGALRYVITSRGSIVYTGIHDPLPGSRQTNVKVKITADMVPSFRIFFYYFTGANEIVSNSLWVDVTDACKRELQVEVPKQVLPGEYVTIEYSGAPNSIIGMSAVDRAAYFLYDESRLTRDSAFKKLNDYDMGCVREGGRNGQHVFEEGGLQIVGGSYSYKEDFSNRCQTGLSGLRKKRQVAVVQAEFERQSLKLKCQLDGYLITLTSETCKERRDYVREVESYECTDWFYQACLERTRSDRVSRTSARALGGNAQGFKALAKARSNFEESILWQTDMLDVQGKLSKRILASDSITTFEFDTVSAHNLFGFCVAETQNMTIFKNLFIQVYSPYSLKRREQAEIRASIFNYGDKTEKVKVSIKVGKDICSHFSEKEFTDLITFDIYPNTAETTSFSILPLRVPESERVSVQLRAQREDGFVLDWIEKEILVEPEGMLKDDIKGTKAIDLKDDNKQAEKFDIDLRFPEKVVDKTRKCWIYPYANYMGPIIEFDPVTKQPKNDIRKIIRMPGGCGEQTMLSVGPNVAAHSYLKAVKKMLPGTPEELGSIAKMKSGFANELKYRSTKYGVWAVFTHYEPSTWLNAYVNKVFAQAKEYYTDMDVKPICDSIKWLPSKQEADGGFHTGGKVLHQEMHGAVGTKLSLTAYVVISLRKSTAVCPALTSATEAAINKAIAYIVKNENNGQLEQPYTLALTTYAMVIADPRNPMTARLTKKLLSKLQYSPDNRLASWKGAPANAIKGTGTHAYWYIRKPLAIDVEATGYALLSLLTGKGQAEITQGYLDLIRKIVLWLIEQRDANGAFSTTQDTVVGLQALSEYMIWSNNVDPPKRDVEIHLTITGINGSLWEKTPKRIFLDKSNENYTTPIQVPQSVIENRFLKVHAEGTGEGSLSYRCVYRTLVEEDACHFQLQVELEKVESAQVALPGSEPPFHVKLKLYISKPVGDPAGQSIVEVNLISGYEPIEATLEQMSRKFVVDGKIERYEIAKQKVILYLKDVTSKPRRLAFLLRRKVFVNKPEPSSVTLYSYYEPTVKCTTFYALGDRIPQLRTTPCKRDANGKDICECAEGGCLTCRSREQQREKTLCSPAMKGKCYSCKENEKCFDMTKAACESNYVYVIQVLDDIENQDGIFVEFRGEIQLVYKMGNDVLAARNQTRKFTTRTDCFQKCEDPELTKGGKDGKKKDFISKGRTMLVMAKAPEQFTAKSGLPESVYPLDENSYVERVFPDDKCKLAKTETENSCADLSKLSKGKKKKCIKHIATKQACENMRQLRRMLIKGCDSQFDERKK